MRLASVFLPALCALFLVNLRVSAQAPGVSHGPREPGTAVLRELSIADGKITFRADSNGCTDASSFKVRVGRQEDILPRTPHYLLTIERVRVDECKAMLWDGVVIELDLEKDLGLTGSYAVSVTNPVLPKGGLAP